jgi:hypothetical protein
MSEFNTHYKTYETLRYAMLVQKLDCILKGVGRTMTSSLNGIGAD